MKIEIRRWDNDEVIICGEYESIKDCLEKNRGKSFYFANLRFADLSSADLRSADLSFADLRSADLRSADLRSADLRSANLRSADLSFANLRFADLRFADLRSADLRSADLSFADLRSADLRSADLSFANLRFADLRFADLRSADLRSADLRSANLSFADLKNIPQLNTPTINEYIQKFKLEKKGEFIFAYKGVSDNLESPMSDVKIKYTKGIKKVDFADCDVWSTCSFGISLSPTIEAAKKYGSKIIKVKVHLGDIACIPIYENSNKFRVKKCEVIGEV